MNKPLISIIVPVYNCKKYLQSCIETIRNQSYQNLEIILVDDGSNDGSATICDELKLIDDRIKVIHQNNKGVSSARNEGIKNANGDYVSFVDADDTIDKNFIETLYGMFDNSIDMAVCGIFWRKQDDFTTIRCDDYRDNGITETLCNEDAIQTVLIGKKFAGHSCNKMFRRSILRKITFREDIFVYEDLLFVIDYLLLCKNIRYNKIPLYNYYIRNDSAMHIKMSQKRMSAFKALNCIEQRLSEQYKGKFINEISYNKAVLILDCYEILSCDNEGRDKYIPYLKAEQRQIKTNRYFGLKMRLKLFLLNINPQIYYRIKSIKK